MSTKTDKTTVTETATPSERPYHPELQRALTKDVVFIAIVLRFVNALAVATFFQPDEYFQALEPAWQLAFGGDSGAWITWEWHHQLRSSLHPILFGAFYFVAERIMSAVQLFPQFQAMMLKALPKVVQGLFAASGDFYTWRLAEKIYGEGSNTAWVALLMSFFSPWQWFCSTRTLSNSLETVVTITALYYWPWSMVGDIELSPKPSNQKPSSAKPIRIFNDSSLVNELRICLLLAGIACILRPTNLLIWAALVVISISHVGLTGSTRTTTNDLLILVREGIVCGSLILSISAISDYLFYGFWTFPPYQWLNFNITQSLAIFYGVNRWDYYLTEGLPLLLTTYLPFALLALYSSTSPSLTTDTLIANARFSLAFIILNTIGTLSLISHKEVRFIYPLLPLLHILSAPHLHSFFASLPLSQTLTRQTRQSLFTLSPPHKPHLYILLTLNILLALYTTQVHQRGVLSVLTFLRSEYEYHHLTPNGEPIPILSTSPTSNEPPFAAFLMPCHSTPWRSHLIHRTLTAWALTCDPPLHLAAGSIERSNYRDEADRFFDDPVGFLEHEVGVVNRNGGESGETGGGNRNRQWPTYVVGFEGVEEAIREGWEKAAARGIAGGNAGAGGGTKRKKRMERKWEGFNSHWHDDERRKGKVVVWMLVDDE